MKPRLKLVRFDIDSRLAHKLVQEIVDSSGSHIGIIPRRRLEEIVTKRAVEKEREWFPPGPSTYAYRPSTSLSLYFKTIDSYLPFP